MTWINDPSGPGSQLSYEQIVYRLTLALEALESIENAWAIDQDQVISATVQLGQKPPNPPWSEREQRLQKIQVELGWLLDKYTQHDEK